MATIKQIAAGESSAPAGFMENLGALLLWVMIEPGRRLEVREMVGRSQFNPAISISLFQNNKEIRSSTIQLVTDLTEADVKSILDLVTP